MFFWWFCIVLLPLRPYFCLAFCLALFSTSTFVLLFGFIGAFGLHLDIFLLISAFILRSKLRLERFLIKFYCSNFCNIFSFFFVSFYFGCCLSSWYGVVVTFFVFDFQFFSVKQFFVFLCFCVAWTYFFIIIFTVCLLLHTLCVLFLCFALFKTFVVVCLFCACCFLLAACFFRVVQLVSESIAIFSIGFHLFIISGLLLFLLLALLLFVGHSYILSLSFVHLACFLCVVLIAFLLSYFPCVVDCASLMNYLLFVFCVCFFFMLIFLVWSVWIIFNIAFTFALCLFCLQ